LVWVNKRQYWESSPVFLRHLLAQDLNILISTGWLYNYLQMRKPSQLSRLQREMLAKVVNSLIGGTP
jgi:hypothetical protein